MASHHTIPVILIDTPSSLRTAVKEFLEQQPELNLVTATDQIETALQILVRQPSTVVLMEMRHDSIFDIQALRSVSPDVPLIVMGHLHESFAKSFTSEMGIDCYLDHFLLVPELVAQIKRLTGPLI